jgi:acyl carrier protein
MPTKKNKKRALDDCKKTVDSILIEELGIQNDEELVPSLEIQALNPDPDDLVYIVVRLEDELEITIPDGAEEKFKTIKDIYDCVERLINKRSATVKNLL